MIAAFIRVHKEFQAPLKQCTTHQYGLSLSIFTWSILYICQQFHRAAPVELPQFGVTVLSFGHKGSLIHIAKIFCYLWALFSNSIKWRCSCSDIATIRVLPVWYYFTCALALMLIPQSFSIHRCQLPCKWKITMQMNNIKLIWSQKWLKKCGTALVCSPSSE